MAKNKKKRKRRVTAQELRQTVAPTKDFEYVNPHDDDDVILVTAQRLSPGHLLQMNNTSLIRAYRQQESNGGKTDTEKQKTETGEEEQIRTEKEILDNLDVIVNNIEYASQISSMSIVDPESGENIYTKQDCLLYFSPDFNTDIANWALAGARPIKEGEDADDVDKFSDEPEQQEGSELEEHPE